MAKAPTELGTGDIYRACDVSELAFETTEDLPPLDDVIGQARAVSSVDFGMGIKDGGYNIFALGAAGTGKTTTISEFLKRQASSQKAPDDWIYVNNFATPYQPNAIRMPSGKAVEFRADMEKLVEDLQGAITQAFEGEEYDKQKREIAQSVGQQQEAKLNALSEKAEQQTFTMVRTPAGLAFAPKTPEGETMSREQYEAMTPEEQAKIDEGIAALNDELQQIMRLVRQDERGGRDALRNLDREVTDWAAKHLIDETAEKWHKIDEVVDYLKTVHLDVVENANDFKKTDEESPMSIMGIPISTNQRNDGAFRKYRVNVLVDNSSQQGAPVTTENNPAMANLVGRIEHQAQFGALITDFNMIKPGALHRANGGYLFLDARDVLTKPYSWEVLKRTIKTREIRIEDLAQQMGFSATATLDPEPIPFDAKIVLIGEPYIYYLLLQHDPEFQELFKVKADFDSVAERTPETEQLYARFIARAAKDRGLQPFSPEGVARIIEHCSRLVSEQDKMTTKFVDVLDLMTEASYWAKHDTKRRKNPIVKREHVQKAIEQKIYRSSRIPERMTEMISQGVIMVDTKGAVVGQINGLSVSSMGDFMFGRPSRITATHRLGDGHVVDVEREVEMGGPIHSKGVLILAGYLGQKYALNRPMSLNARLVFEQSYSGVEGDSASSTELYALLSSLSGLPISQRFAVTGSVNQLGQVQAIGGVNEKIEGYFEVVQALGAKGDEGVLIPKTNVRNLMLNDQVREAVAKGKFHIYPVTTIDEGIELLTGVTAGKVRADGSYPKGTVNALVVARLSELAEKSRSLSQEKKDEKPSAKNGERLK